MASEVKIKVTVENDTKGGLSGVTAGLHDVETAADKAGNKVSDFGRRSSSIKGDLAGLDSGIAKSTESLRMLASALANTDDAAQRIDIKKAMSKVQSDLSAASKAKKIKLTELMDLKPDPAAAQSFMSKLGGQLSSLGPQLSSAVANPVGLALGSGIAIAAAPQLASVMSGLISSGAGLAVIGAGIALAVKNDAGIQQAGQDAGLKFMKALGKGVQVYEGPIRSSLGILEDAGGRVATKLSSAFSATASSIVPLVRDITQGIEGFVDSIANIASNSGPALAGFGDMFRLIMDGLGEGLEAMSSDSESAGATLVMLGGIIGDLIQKTGEFIGWLNKMSDLPGPIKMLKNYYQNAADASDNMVGSQAKLAESMTNAEKAARGEVGALSALSQELKAQTDPVFGLIKAQQDMKKAQDDAKKAVKDHGKTSDEAKDAYRRQALAAIDLEGQVGKLGSQFNGKMTPALRSTLKAAGLTDGAIKNLEGQFADAKRTGDKFAKTYKATARVEGAAAARNALYGVQDAANSIPRAVTIAMRITGVSSVSKAAAAVRKQYAHGGITGAANGGVQGGGYTWVGEQGPELMKLPAGTTVRSNPDSMRTLTRGDMGRYHSEMNGLWEDHAPSRTELAGRNRPGSPYRKKKSSGGGGSGGSGGGGGSFDGELVARWEPSGNAFLDALADVIRLYVKNNGGGNVQDALGQRGRG